MSSNLIIHPKMLTEKLIINILKNFSLKGKSLKFFNLFFLILQKIAKNYQISMEKLILKVFLLSPTFLPIKLLKIKTKRGKRKKKIIIPLSPKKKYSPINLISYYIATKIKNLQKHANLPLKIAIFKTFNDIYLKPSLFTHYFKSYKQLKLIKKRRAYLQYTHWFAN